MAKGPSTKAVAVLLLIGICVVGALAWYVKTDPLAAKVPADMHRIDDQPDVAMTHRTPRPKPEEEPMSRPKTSQTVLVPSFDGGHLGPDMAKSDVPNGKEPKVFLTEEIIKGVKIDNARVLGVDVKNGTAVINFGDGIDSGMGSDQEALFLDALKKAFGQFPEVNKLQLDKEGEPLDSVGGHIDLTDGLEVTRPGTPTSAPTPSSP